jgi:hypothetical protein
VISVRKVCDNLPGAPKFPALKGPLAAAIKKERLYGPNRQWQMFCDKRLPEILGNCYSFGVCEHAFYGPPN